MSKDAWFLVKDKKQFSKFNLFCFPHAGGGASFFNDWPQFLPDLVQVLSVQLPGREARHSENFLQNINDVLNNILEFKDIFYKKPFALFGHSLGAVLAFELARKLFIDKSPTPTCLIVSGHCAPKFSEKQEKIYSLPDDKFVKRMNELYGGIDSEVLCCPELLELLLPRFRADILLSEQYKYNQAPSLKCPIFVFNGNDDVSVNSDELSEWGLETDNAAKIYKFPGDHFFISDSKEIVLDRLSKILRNFL
ncbi:MAG: alpha/beta fold hydrolase [Gammaproteobacteria bacterium]|jgi:surfactin synthase thioesterase subunit